MSREGRRLKLDGLLAAIFKAQEPDGASSPHSPVRRARRAEGADRPASVETFRQALTRASLEKRPPSAAEIEAAEATASRIVGVEGHKHVRAQLASARLEGAGGPMALDQSFQQLRAVQNSLQRAYIDDPEPSPEATQRLDRLMSAIVKYEALLGRESLGVDPLEAARAAVARRPRLQELGDALARHIPALRSLADWDELDLSEQEDVLTALADLAPRLEAAWALEPDGAERMALRAVAKIFNDTGKRRR